MSRVETIHIENRRKIKDIIIKFPELMEPSAKDRIAEEYYNILSKEDELHETRHKVWQLEEEVKRLRNEFSLKSNLFEIEFETDEKEVHSQRCSMTIQGCDNTKY